MTSLRELVRLHLREAEQDEAEQLAAREKFRSEGRRLVSVDQPAPDTASVHDAETHELLLLGSLDDVDALFDAEPELINVDWIDWEYVQRKDTYVPDLPKELQSVIRDWVDNNREEAAEFATGED